jgi:maleate cis-trans isomerase
VTTNPPDNGRCLPANVRPIDYGARLRAGVIVPSGNTVAEPEIAAMLPPGVRANITRLPLTGSRPEEIAAMTAGAGAAVRLLADARPELIAFHCTAATTTTKRKRDELERALSENAVCPTLTTGDALLAAFARLEMRRVVLVTPYTAEVHRHEEEFLADHDIKVIGGGYVGLETNTEMSQLSLAELYEFALEQRTTGADGYLYSCTAIRTAPIIDALEDALGAPVITSNQAISWHLLRSGQIDDQVDGYGALLRL